MSIVYTHAHETPTLVVYVQLRTLPCSVQNTNLEERLLRCILYI